jgi:Tfp pilus assembly protein PilE
MTTARQSRHQRGITLIGLLLWAIVIGFFALLAMRVLPTINEFFTIQRAVNKIAAEGLSTVPEIRAAFERQKQIEYSIQSISGKDLEVTKENDKVVIRFAYNKEVEIASPVYLLIKYQGSSKAK